MPPEIVWNSVEFFLAASRALVAQDFGVLDNLNCINTQNVQSMIASHKQ